MPNNWREELPFQTLDKVSQWGTIDKTLLEEFIQAKFSELIDSIPDEVSMDMKNHLPEGLWLTKAKKDQLKEVWLN